MADFARSGTSISNKRRVWLQFPLGAHQLITERAWANDWKYYGSLFYRRLRLGAHKRVTLTVDVYRCCWTGSRWTKVGANFCDYIYLYGGLGDSEYSVVRSLSLCFLLTLGEKKWMRRNLRGLSEHDRKIAQRAYIFYSRFQVCVAQDVRLHCIYADILLRPAPLLILKLP